MPSDSLCCRCPPLRPPLSHRTEGQSTAPFLNTSYGIWCSVLFCSHQCSWWPHVLHALKTYRHQGQTIVRLQMGSPHRHTLDCSSTGDHHWLLTREHQLETIVVLYRYIFSCCTKGELWHLLLVNRSID